MDESTPPGEEDFLASAPQRFSTFFAVLDELETESDRGVAILGVSLLDARIQDLLLHLLVPSKESKDLVKRAPFAGRLGLALSTGLIERSEYAECNRLRSVRNDFAHVFAHRFSFSDPKVASRCRDLKFYYFTDKESPQEAARIEDMPTEEELEKLAAAASPRQRFIRSVAQVYMNWILREFHTQHRQMKPGGLDALTTDAPEDEQ